MAEYFTLTDAGKVRKANEDYISTAQTDNGVLLVVCDGLGGLQGGEIASSLAAETLTREFRSTSTIEEPYRFLYDSIEKANQALRDFLTDHPDYEAIGTTIVAAFIRNDELYIAHVGDSRAYLMKREILIMLTKDHSTVQELIDMGLLKPEQAFNHPQKNLITRSLGDPISNQPDITGPIKLSEGDKVFLCTDGVTAHLKDRELVKFLSLKNHDKICDKILAACLKKGGIDNISMICYIC